MVENDKPKPLMGELVVSFSALPAGEDALLHELLISASRKVGSLIDCMWNSEQSRFVAYFEEPEVEDEKIEAFRRPVYEA